jgi:hypothetical protein
MRDLFSKINKNKWYWKEILKNFKKSFSSVSIYILFLALLSVWKFLIGQDFFWESISPIPEPNIFIRVLYSAITFVSLGSVLYRLCFYKWLHNVCVKCLGNWQLYKGIKKIIWIALMFVMFVYVVPFIVLVLNSVISFFFNIFKLILYLFPPFGFAVFVYFIFIVVNNEKRLQIEEGINKLYKNHVRLKLSRIFKK